MAITKVSQSLIADNAIGLAQLAGGTDGNLITYDASGNPAAVSTGSANQVLVSAGAGAPPTFQAVPTVRSGEIIEQIAMVCDGTTQTVASGTYTSQNVTGVLNLTTSYQDVTGSLLAYTPPSGTTRVVYTFAFQGSFADVSSATGISHWRLYLDSDEVTRARRTIGGATLEIGGFIQWVFQIGGTAATETGRVSSWGSAKTIKLQARENAAGNQFKVHSNFYWDGSSDPQDVKPVITVAAIR